MSLAAVSLPPSSANWWRPSEGRNSRAMKRPPSHTDWPTSVANAADEQPLELAIADLKRLRSSGFISPITAINCARVAIQLFHGSTLSASVTPEGDGGCTLYWVAGRASIDFSVDDTNAWFCRVTDGLGRVQVEAEFDEAPIQQMRIWLNNFAKYVEVERAGVSSQAERAG